VKDYVLRLVIPIWTLIMHALCVMIFSMLFMSFLYKYVSLNAWNVMMSVALLICYVWKNRMFRFLWFCWQNRMLRFFKLDCLVLVDLAYVSPILFIIILLSYASRITYSHTHYCCTSRMHTYRRSSLVFFWKKCAKWHFRSKLNSILYAHIKGELTLYVWVQNAY
jgi:hypothetical protein